MFFSWPVGVETSAATASFHPRHTLPSYRLLGATASAWREKPRSSPEHQSPVSPLWYVTSEGLRALCDLEVYANHCASMMTLLPWPYALICSLTCLSLLMAEAISSFDIYLRYRAWLVQRTHYTYQLHHPLRISADSSSFRSRGLDWIAVMWEVSLVVAEEEGASS